MSIQFDHFSIRLLSSGDLQEYFQLIERNRRRLEDFFTGTVSRTKTLEETKQFVKEITQKAEQKIYFPYLIINNDNNSIVGFIDVKNIDWSIPKAELGCY